MSPDGTHIVSSASDFSVRVWEAESGRQVFCLIDSESAARLSGEWSGPRELRPSEELTLQLRLRRRRVCGRGRALDHAPHGAAVLVVLPGVGVAVAERLRSAAEHEVSPRLPALIQPITVSVSLAFRTIPTANATELLDCNDQALYRAADGHNRTRVMQAQNSTVSSITQNPSIRCCNTMGPAALAILAGDKSLKISRRFVLDIRDRGEEPLDCAR